MKDKNFSGHGVPIRTSAAELRLLVRILARDAAGIDRCLRADPAILNRLAETCNRSGLSIVLLRALELLPIRSGLTPRQIESLNEAWQVQRERLQVLTPALLRLAELFESRNLPFILLKGPYLASRFYGDILGREFVDLDLLVHGRDWARACEVLKIADFHRQSGILLHEGLTRFFVHAFDFRSGKASVDLHWNLSRHISLRIDEKQVWTRRSSYCIEGRSYPVLSDEHEVIFAALSLLRDFERGRLKPKNIIDMIRIAMAVDGQLNWSNLLSAGDGTAGPLVHMVGLCLTIADAHDFVPNLAAALNSMDREDILPVPNAADSANQLPPRFLGVGNKLWAARAYNCSPAAYWFWWALSLPFRLRVHRRPPRAG